MVTAAQKIIKKSNHSYCS